MTTNIDCVIFDLGGVLIELDGPPVSSQNSDLTEPEIWRRWLYSTAVRDFESGKCTALEFAEALVLEFKLEQTPEAFLDDFDQWPKGVFVGAEALLANLKPRTQLACLSNTNQLHWDRFGQTHHLLEHFDQVFASFLTGYLKPDKSAFEHTISGLDMAPSRLLFLDDNAVNVDAARNSGMQAELTRGPSEASVHLKRYGLL
jgi:HAD superfamily hydrolase (TIGR01509 family)